MSSGIVLRQVGVVEHDGRRLAAQFEGAALEHLAADGTHLAAGRGRAGESDLVDAGVAHDVLADLTARGEDRHHALGQFDLVEHLAQQVGVERGLGRRLEDHG